MRNKIRVVYDIDEVTVTASTKHRGKANRLDTREVNRLAGILLHKLADAVGQADEGEFDGISQMTFGNGRIAVTANLFIP